MIIKSNHCYISVAFTVMLLLYTETLFAASSAEVISLQADKLEHIQFKKITANRVSYQDQQLQIDVDNSASILMLPFEYSHCAHMYHVNRSVILETQLPEAG